MQRLKPVATASLGLPDGGYHYSLCPLPPLPGAAKAGVSDFAIISSDDLIRVYQTTSPTGKDGRSNSLGHHKGVSCIAPFPGSVGGGWMTGGRDGLIKHWDARARPGLNDPTWQYLNSRKAAYLSIASDRNGFLWASGTELTGSVAEIQIWDYRKMGAPMANYVECHNDDISVLNFSSSTAEPTTLLSGSTDGLVNVYSSTFPSDEEDALTQVINHGSSIHQAGFLPCNPYFSGNADSAIYALSHDEKFSLYKRERNLGPEDEDISMEIEADEEHVLELGDVRPTMSCEYVIDVIAAEQGAILAVGSHSEQRIDFIPLTYIAATSLRKSWTLSIDPVCRLEGGHGEEIVRDVILFEDGESRLIVTAGEDGLIRVWPAHDATMGYSAANAGPSMGTVKRSMDEEKATSKNTGVDRGKERQNKKFKPY